MRKKNKIIEHEEIHDILLRNDSRVVFEKTNVIPDSSNLYRELKKYIGLEKIGKKAVLGIDMYQYSSYGSFEQTLVPFLFTNLFRAAIRLCLTNHAFIFQKYSEKDMQKSFINTGDGGFLILDNPLHSVLFASNFAVLLRAYNAHHYYPRLRNIIGGVYMRYAVTYDKVYEYNDNFFGRAIINNARILRKDNLNRCLVDENVHTWFTSNLDGVENLQIVTLEDISNIFEFNKNYDRDFLKKGDEIFENESSRRYGIINSDILKVGSIQVKDTYISIYNLHLQIAIRLYKDEDEKQNRLITVSLGNLNTSGI